MQCGNCKYWQKTGLEDSGMPLTKTENWLYHVGKCLADYSLGMPTGDKIPGWLKACFNYRKRKEDG